MKKFSERYECIDSSLIRGRLTNDIINSICSAYDLIQENMSYNSLKEMKKHLWCHCFNRRLKDYYIQEEYDFQEGNNMITEFIESENPWYKILDLIEDTISYLDKEEYDIFIIFTDYLIEEFRRLNFAYQIVDNKIIEVVSELEIKEIKTALDNSIKGVREHLQSTLKLLSIRPNGDYRNSIKESISAVEALIREITGEKTLNFKALKSKNIILPSVLENAFKHLYGYTNDESTGIRHALMDDTNMPNDDEAIFMLVSCSAFINYLTKKKK